MNIDEEFLISTPFLQPGYYLLTEKRALKLSKKNLKRLLNPRFLYEIFTESIIVKKINHSNANISGDEMIFGLSSNQLIIIEDNIVYRKYISYKKYIRLKRFYPEIKKLQSINKTKFLGKNVTKEKFLKGKLMYQKPKSKQKEIFNRICNDYLYYFEHSIESKSVIIDLQCAIERLINNKYPDYFINLIEDKSNKIENFIFNVKWVISHCDLAPNNIFIVNDDIVIIDIEHLDSMPAYYDIVNLFITTTARRGNSNLLINKFFHGEYDFVFQKILPKSEYQIFLKNRLIIIAAYLIIKLSIAWDSESSNEEPIRSITLQAIEEMVSKVLNKY